MLTTTSTHGLKFQVRDSTVVVPGGTARIGSGLLYYNGGQKTFNDMLAPGGDTSRYYNSILYLAPVDATNFNSVLNMTSIRSAAATSPAGLSNPALPTLSYPIGLFTLYSSDGTHFSSLISSIEPAGSSGGTQGLTGVQGIQGPIGPMPSGDLTGTSLSVSGGITGVSYLNIGSGNITCGDIYGNNILGASLNLSGGITGAYLNVGTGDISGGNISGNNLLCTDIRGSSLNVYPGGITGAYLNVGSGDISGNNIKGRTLSVSGGISGASLNVGSGSITCGNISSSSILNSGALTSSSILGGDISGGYIHGTSILSGAIRGTSLSVSGGITGAYLNVGSGDISGNNIKGKTLSVSGGITGASLNVGSGNISGGDIYTIDATVSGNLKTNRLLVDTNAQIVSDIYTVPATVWTTLDANIQSSDTITVNDTKIWYKKLGTFVHVNFYANITATGNISYIRFNLPYHPTTYSSPGNIIGLGCMQDTGSPYAMHFVTIRYLSGGVFGMRTGLDVGETLSASTYAFYSSFSFDTTK